MDLQGPTAEGDFARTPFAHLLVFAMDRRLTGVMYADESPSVSHAVAFERGAVVHVTSGHGFARLGKLLMEEGLVEPDVLAEALDAEAPLGRALIAAGALTPESLASLLDEQLRRRVLRLFMLPPATTYRYFEGHEPLAPRRAVRVNSLALLWEGLRAHAECSPLFETTLACVRDAPLRLHPEAQARQLELVGDERLAVALLAGQPSSLAELVESGIIGEAPLRRLLYALTITRMLVIEGSPSGLPPVSIEEAPPSAPPSSPRVAASLGRMKLVRTAVRLGAALEDPPGAGEPLVFGKRAGLVVDQAPSSAARWDDPRAEPDREPEPEPRPKPALELELELDEGDPLAKEPV